MCHSCEFIVIFSVSHAWVQEDDFNWGGGGGGISFMTQ